MKLLACFRPTYRVDIYTSNMNNHARFPFSWMPPLRNNRVAPFPSPSIPFSARSLRGRGIETSDFEATREQLPPLLPRRFNIRAASRDSPLWNLVLFGTRPTLFPRFSRYYVSPPILGLPKMARDGRYGNSARRNPGCYCRTELTFRLSPTSRGDWS